MKYKILIILSCIIVFVLIFKYDSTDYFKNINTTVSSVGTLYESQVDINKTIEKYKKNSYFTIENPKIFVNPYKISPLSALIVFMTDNNCEIEITINNEYKTKFKESKTHVIPIYGLYENKNNEVIISTSDGKNKTIYIKTEKSENINLLNVEKVSKDLNDELYFMTSPVGTPASAYDKNGNLKWYLTETFTMDFEWLSNGHFLVGVDEGSVNDRKIGFVEMDYLGKIYNYYISEYGCEFEFQVLSNNNYMLAGGNIPIYYDHAYVYEINSKNGEVESFLDLYELFKSVDSKFDEEKLNYKIIRNSFYYNEKTNEILLSLRGLNSIVSVNYKTKKINYIFAPPGIYSEKFDKYMVKLLNGRYPLGIHSVFMTNEGYVGFINNGYDRLHGHEVGQIDEVSAYKNNYTSAEIYKIENKEANLMWSYDANKKYFSHQYGSFTNLKNSNFLVNFGWTLSDEYRNLKGATLSQSEKSIDYADSIILEMNSENEILFKATIDDGKYRIFKHSLYNDINDNLDPKIYNSYNTLKSTKLEKIKTRKIEKDINNSQKYDNTLSFTKNSLKTDRIIDDLDKIDILFVGAGSNSYKVSYKKEEKNIDKTLNINLKKGKYALYLIINDVYYKTNMIVRY